MSVGDNLRLAPGKLLAWRDTRRERGFSNFLFVDQHYGAHPVLRRILSLARKRDFQSVLIEEVGAADCAVLAEEDEALARRQPDFTGSTVHRISFFRTLPRRKPAPDDFIGGVVFKTDHFTRLGQPRRHVYEALLPSPRNAAQNNFLHCARSYDFHTAAGEFSAVGALYAQQNDLTFVCAHVALRTVLASVLPDADVTYARMNALAGVDHRAVQVGAGRGLETEQVQAVLDGLGVAYDKTVHEPLQQLILPTDYQRHLYGGIESGAPALLGFELSDPAAPPGEAGRHLIPVLGHTFNDDAWVPEAQRNYFAGGLSYYPSESWLSAFIVHDDNFGPYYCLPRNFLRKDNFRLVLALKRHPTTFSPLVAETLAFGLATVLSNVFGPRTSHAWLDRFTVFTRSNSLVLRTQCVTREDYLRHLGALEDWEGRRPTKALQAVFRRALPEFFWMVELSAPELFSASRRKFGELLLAADRPATPDLSLLLAARLPAQIILRTSAVDLTLQSTNVRGHTQLFTRPS